MKFNKNACAIFFVVLIIEILIALFIHDSFVRPFVGDLLVIFVLYYFCKTFTEIHYSKLLPAVLAFAFLIEATQFFKLLEVLGLQNSPILNIVLGSTFDWYDLLAYSLGAAFVYLVEVLT